MHIGILGAGFTGGTHARAFAQIDGMKVATIVSTSPDRGAPLAATWGATFTQSADDALIDPSIVSVSICLRTPWHRELAECCYFVECVRTGAPPARATPEDGRLALAVALAALQPLESPSLTTVEL